MEIYVENMKPTVATLNHTHKKTSHDDQTAKTDNKTGKKTTTKNYFE